MTQPAGIAAFLLLGVAAVAFAAYYFFAPANQEPYRHSNNRDHSYRDYVPPQQTQTRSDNTNGYYILLNSMQLVLWCNYLLSILVIFAEDVETAKITAQFV